MHWLIETVLYTVVNLIGYTVARFVLPLLSFRRIYVQPINAPLGTRFNALGYRHDEGGRIEIETSSADLVGFIICLFAFFTFYFLIRSTI